MPQDDDLRETVRSYDEHAQQYADEWFDKPLAAHIRSFAATLRPGASVLDAGGGHGRDSAELAKHGFEPCLLDLSAGLLAEARARGVDVCMVQGDLRALPFRDRSFDGVWACASLVHLERAQIPGALRELHRVTCEGGTLFISMRVGSGEGWEMWNGLRRFYTYVQPTEAVELLEDAGWSVSWWGVERSRWFSAIGTRE